MYANALETLPIYSDSAGTSSIQVYSAQETKIMTKLKEITVLYIDDEIHNLNAFLATFRKDFNVLVANSALEGFGSLEKNVVQIVITDQGMPDMMGVELLVEVLKEHPHIVRVLLTGFADTCAIVDALSKGEIHHRMEKLWDAGEIRAVIQAACEIWLARKNGGEAHRIEMAGRLEFLRK